MSNLLSVRRSSLSSASGRFNGTISVDRERATNTIAASRRVTAAVLVLGCLCAGVPARPSDPHPVRDVTIPAEAKARLALQSQINSKLSEVDDIVTATLTEPIYVEGELVLPRGTEFQGRIVSVGPSKRRQRSSHISINFERVVTASGVVPISAQVTAIDDWDKEESIKADSQGKMKGGHQGSKTIDNMRKGTSLGLSAGFIGALLTGSAGASGRQVLGVGGVGMAVGMIGGILLTKGSEIRVAQGAILRIKFLRAATLPVVQQPRT